MDEFTQNTPDDRHTKYPKLFHSAIDIQVFRLYDALLQTSFLMCLSLHVSWAESTPRAFHVWPMIEGPPRFGRSTSPLPRMEHCKKACRACAMSHWGLGGDLLLVLHTTVVVQTLRFVTWRCTRCWWQPQHVGVLLC